MDDELDTWADRMMKRPEFRRAYYRLMYSQPLPLRGGPEYRRRRRRR